MRDPAVEEGVEEERGRKGRRADGDVCSVTAYDEEKSGGDGGDRGQGRDRGGGQEVEEERGRQGKRADGDVKTCSPGMGRDDGWRGRMDCMGG